MCVLVKTKLRSICVLRYIFKRHLNIVNGGTGPLLQVHLVGRCALARACTVVNAKLANQILRLPVFECTG